VGLYQGYEFLLYGKWSVITRVSVDRPNATLSLHITKNKDNRNGILM